MNVHLNLSMFRAYDIRTPSSRLTPELAVRLARAEAVFFRDELGASSVLVAHDARRTGPHYLSLGVDAYREAGLEVRVIPGVCSTSMFYFAAMRDPNSAAVMFGASHNPADDTGQKLLAPGVVPLAEGIGPGGGLDRIKQLYISGARGPGPRRGPIRPVEVMPEYLDYSMSRAGVAPGGLAGLPVFADFLNGAAGREFMLAFDRAGARLEPLHFAADGAFPLGDPNPVKRSVIRDGLEALKAGDYRLGFFLDGDGDRLDVYRGDGAYLSSSFVYAAILPEIRGRFPGPNMGVFADLKSNPLAVIEMARAGVSVDVIRNGHSQIKEALARDPSRLGCVEESAHFYEAFTIEDGPRACTENTLYLALLIARVWQDDPGRFERLFAIQATTVREREWGYKFPSDAARADALAATRAHFEAQGFAAMDRMANGMHLEATLLRRGLPLAVDESTTLADDWLQVCQRESQSEDGLARWEVVGASAPLVREAKRQIEACVAGFGAGDEYQG
jgi:phosphomannomutase